jgi:hypothetical protein
MLASSAAHCVAPQWQRRPRTQLLRIVQKKFAKKATLDPAVYPFFYTGHRVVT